MANSKLVEVTLDECDRETMINYYVQDHMSDEAWETFMESCHDDFYNDKHYEVALADAVVNEMVNIILKESIDDTDPDKRKGFFLFG